MADLHSKILDAHPPGVQILSISCSFWENLAKLYVGAPPGELAPPPRGNPRSATVFRHEIKSRLEDQMHIYMHVSQGIRSKYHSVYISRQQTLTNCGMILGGS